MTYQAIFESMPVAVIVAENRVMTDCNLAAMRMFRGRREDIVAQPFSILYPDQDEFMAAGRRMEPLLSGRMVQYDNRIMRRLDGSHFWVTVRGHAFNPAIPFEMTVWSFSELSDRPEQFQTAIQLTQRERDVAALLVDKLTSKQIAKALDISPKTVDIHRASLLKKYGVPSTRELLQKLRS